PGNTIGDEFVYPRDQALKIAKATHEPVLSIADESNIKSAEVTRVDENGAGTDRSKSASTTTTTAPTGTSGSSAPRMTEQTARAATPTTTGAATAAPHSTAANSSRTRRLPRTGSPLALYELMSGLAFAGAVGIRKLRIRR